jgi:hypothetical protein
MLIRTVTCQTFKQIATCNIAHKRTIRFYSKMVEPKTPVAIVFGAMTIGKQGQATSHGQIANKLTLGHRC